jgi:hypothetical protein
MQPCYYREKNSCTNQVSDGSYLCTDCKKKEYPDNSLKKRLEDLSKLSKYRKASKEQLIEWKSTAESWLIINVGHPRYEIAVDRHMQICDELKRRAIDC